MQHNWLNETKRWMGILVENGDILYTDKLLTESQESKSIDAAKKLVIQKLNYTPKQADEFIRIELRDKLPVLRDKNAAKFILGATRMYVDGQLRDASAISALNTTLKYVASDAHYNEYDRNLNGISAQDLIQRFAKNIEMDLENDRNKVNSMQFEGQSQYDIVRIDSFEQACEYNKYTYKDSQWCLTYSKSNYDSYSCNGVNQIYFCLRKGFESVEPVPGKGCPLDEYGLSMISIIVNENGALVSCTSRWNHANGGNDHVMDDTTKISQEIGVNFYNVFKPNNKWKELVDNVMQRLRNGENPRVVFDRCGAFQNGFARVYLNKKCNFIKEDGSFVSPNQWFDNCYDFYNGFAKVELNRKWNLIKQDGSILFPDQWFDYCGDFEEGFAQVKLNEKWNLIKPDGSLIRGDFNSLDQWFDMCGHFKEGFAIVELNGKENYIRADGSLLSPNQWFDECYCFNDYYAKIELNGKDYYIDTQGKLFDPTTGEPIDMNVSNMNSQNEAIRNTLTNMIVENVMCQIKNEDNYNDRLQSKISDSDSEYEKADKSCGETHRAINRIHNQQQQLRNWRSGLPIWKQLSSQKRYFKLQDKLHNEIKNELMKNNQSAIKRDKEAIRGTHLKGFKNKGVKISNLEDF